MGGTWVQSSILSVGGLQGGQCPGRGRGPCRGLCHFAWLFFFVGELCSLAPHARSTNLEGGLQPSGEVAARQRAGAGGHMSRPSANPSFSCPPPSPPSPPRARVSASVPDPQPSRPRYGYRGAASMKLGAAVPLEHLLALTELAPPPLRAHPPLSLLPPLPSLPPAAAAALPPPPPRTSLGPTAGPPLSTPAPPPSPWHGAPHGRSGVGPCPGAAPGGGRQREEPPGAERGM